MSEDTTDTTAVEPVEDEPVEIYPARHLLKETAQALLKAAEDLGHDVQHAVQSIGPGGFRVPKDVADAAVLPVDDPADDKAGDPEPQKTAPTPKAAIAKGAGPGGADAAS